MAEITPGAEPGRDELIRFEGDWKEFLGLAVVNLLLTIVTFGIYRFWAKTRVRQYLWSRTTVMGEPLEYTGTGLQLFLGALIATLALFVPLVILNTVAQILIMTGHPAMGMLLNLGMLVVLGYLVGVGIYRSQRYLLAQTSWRGIRGGMTTGGWAYGVSFLWRNAVAGLTLFLARPWADTRLWNERWRDTRFGSLEVTAEAPARPLFLSYIAALVASIVLYVVFILSLSASPVDYGNLTEQPSAQQMVALFLSMFWQLAALLVGLALVSLIYRAAYWRHVIGHTRLDGVELRFNATMADWFRFMLGNIALVVLTLGFGIVMLPYRIFAFALGHLEAEGALDPNLIAQSRLAQPMQGDGIADAFDLSPI